jgi:hypothetical protein
MKAKQRRKGRAFVRGDRIVFVRDSTGSPASTGTVHFVRGGELLVRIDDAELPQGQKRWRVFLASVRAEVLR